MNSIAFPEMFVNSKTQTVSDHEATFQNLKNLLLTPKKSLYGDPYYGCNLKKLLFEPNNVVLKDIVIDDIYTAVGQFIPQIKLNRNDITIITKGDTMYITIKALNLLDYTTDTYNIPIINYEVE